MVNKLKFRCFSRTYLKAWGLPSHSSLPSTIPDTSPQKERNHQGKCHEFLMPLASQEDVGITRFALGKDWADCRNSTPARSHELFDHTRIALRPRAGQKVLTLRDHSLGITIQETQRCVSAQGFRLHADVRCATHQRRTLEPLCRYITRADLGHKRLTRTRAGEVVLHLKTPYRNGTTHWSYPSFVFRLV